MSYDITIGGKTVMNHNIQNNSISDITDITYRQLASYL